MVKSSESDKIQHTHRCGVSLSLRITSLLLAAGGIVVSLVFIMLTDLRDTMVFWCIWLMVPFLLVLVLTWWSRNRSTLYGIVATAFVIFGVSGLGIYLYHQYGIKANNERALLPGFWPIFQLVVVIFLPLLFRISASLLKGVKQGQTCGVEKL